MPPAIFVGAVRAYHSGGANYKHIYDVPATVRPGDVMIALRAGDGDDASNTLDAGNSPQDWTQIGKSTLAQANFLACGRVAKISDPGTIQMWSAGAFTWEESLLLVYRNVDPSIVLVDGCSANNIGGTTNFTSPARVLTRYSDLYIGFTAVKTDTAITMPAGCTQRIQSVGFTAGRRFAAWDLLTEATGSTGTKTATTAVGASGCAGSLALAADGLRAGGKTLSGLVAVPGMLGLPTLGV